MNTKSILKERIEHIQRALETNSPGSDTVLRERLAEARYLYRFLLQILGDTAGSPFGVELIRDVLGNRDYCAITPDANVPGGARLVRFDRRGLYGHTVFSSPTQALENALVEGYHERVDGAMDLLSKTKEWARGENFRDMIQQFNAGEINLAEFRRATAEPLAA